MSKARKCASALLDFRESGRPRRIAGTRGPSPGPGHIAIYRVMGDADRVRIILVPHGAQMWLSELDDE
ncbi:type II toxin-antitoxin system RelE/ParE family toxin [Sinorhizobium meliloti]|uniref:type II toxin-antitoxin system RelE/ParE family toxin n=1 Tax=Rhizobium meliloti TaxID=382 RepID=UPI003D650670